MTNSTKRLFFNFIRNGFTLVELLVVISIIAVLVGMMVPAVQSVRESARQTECKNNLKQIGLGFQSHHEANGNWPANGWGYGWAGDPNMGNSRRQPGGWMYNILPYTDYQNIWELGLNVGTSYTDTNRKNAIGEQIKTPTKYMNCPSRRANKAYPNSANQAVVNATAQSVHARADYAVNAGNFSNCTTGYSLPGCIGSVDNAYANPTSLNWNALDRGNCSGYSTYSNSGISYFASQFTESDVKDGLSNTLCVGEKYLPINQRLDGQNGCDNNPAYVGYDWDNVRWGPAFQGQTKRPDDFTKDSNLAPIVDSNSLNRGSTAYRMPTRDEKTFFTKGNPGDAPQFFGSSHSAFFQGVMCDGAVRTFTYKIDPRVMGCYCNRMDGVSIESITAQ